MNEIQVECYAGYRGEQEPRTLIVGGRRLGIQEILGRSIGPAGRRFRVRCVDGSEYELLHDGSTGVWTETGRG